MYDSIPSKIRAQIIRSCNKYGISSPEDVETAYNNFTQGKGIFEDLSDSFYRAQGFKRFLEGGEISHKYSGEDEPTGKMTISKLNKKSIVPVSVWHTPKGYTYNLPEVTVTPQSNPDDMLKMRRAINQGMNKAGEIGAEALSYASIAPAILAAPGAALLGLTGGVAGASTGAKIGEYIAGDTGALYGGIAGGLIGGGLGAGFASPNVRSFINSSNTGKWTKFGNREYRLNPNSLSANGTPIESRGIQLSETQINNGWKIDADGFAVNPKVKGKRFLRNSEGKLVSEDSYQQELNAKNLNKQMLDTQKANKLRAAKEKADANKIYDKLDNLGIKGIREEYWFQERPTSGKGSVSDEDIATWRSHLPEYLQKAKDYINNDMLYTKNKKWYGKFQDGDVEVNPAEYIVAHSNAFKKAKLHYDGRKWYSGMSKENYNKLIDNGGIEKDAVNWNTTNENYAKEIAKAVDKSLNKNDALVVESMVGQAHPQDIVIAETKSNYPKPLSYTETGKPAGAIVKQQHENKGTIDFPVIYTDVGMGRPEHWRVFGEDSQIKFLRGNNGNFNMSNFNPFKSLVAPILTAKTAYEIINNNE